MPTATSRNKEHLLKVAQRHKEQLGNEIELLTATTKDIGIKILAVGSILCIAYLLIKKIRGDFDNTTIHKSKQTLVKSNTTKATSLLSSTGNWVARELCMWLLSVAKKRLSEFIHELNAQSNEHIKNT